MSRQVLEGTWEEVARHAEELAGKRVRLIVIGDALPMLERPLSAALEGILGAIDSTDQSQLGHPATSFSEIIAEKFRKQGLRIP